MLLYGGLIGYLLYSILIILKKVDDTTLTTRQQWIVNVLAPGIGYYYNGKMRRATLFFCIVGIQALIVFVGMSPLIAAIPATMMLMYCAYKDYMAQSLIQQLKRLEKIVHKKPVIALDFATMSNRKTRQRLLKLYERTNYEFAIARPLVDELEKLNMRRTLELMFHEGRLRILHYNVTDAMRQYAMMHQESETMAHYIVDSIEKKEVYVLPLSFNTPNFPGIVSLKQK
ncbi:hypothetical protein [Kurthia massiliensis]|uniref:hypothetical protein n=1 Tax=Kurthia massiliensis TaxID=1033739 RepID=UPI00028A09B2|nr:hypothetical protein [Kurthia massiliensis]